MDSARLRDNLEAVRERIGRAVRRSGRTPEVVRLVAVTKRRPTEASRVLAGCGVVDQGENYPQELWAKAEATEHEPIRWHLIGHLQGNKARKTLPLVRMVHAVDSLKLLRLLADLAAGLPDPPSACLQVNVSEEAAKHGWSVSEILAESREIAATTGIPIVGLMTIAAQSTTPEGARPAFAKLRAVRDELRTRTGLALPELSMGMSGDYEVAIEEGATLVRVGSALFEGIDP